MPRGQYNEGKNTELTYFNLSAVILERHVMHKKYPSGKFT